MGLIWSSLASPDSPSFQRMWPIPGLYLGEAVVLPALVLWAVLVADYRAAWLAMGALATLALLGAMSIGLLVALSLIFLVPACVLGDDGRSPASQKVAAFLLGCLFQGGVMFGLSSTSCVVRCLRRTAADCCSQSLPCHLPQVSRGLGDARPKGRTARATGVAGYVAYLGAGSASVGSPDWTTISAPFSGAITPPDSDLPLFSCRALRRRGRSCLEWIPRRSVRPFPP